MWRRGASAALEPREDQHDVQGHGGSPGSLPAPMRASARRHLEADCGRDAEGMVWIVEALRGAID